MISLKLIEMRKKVKEEVGKIPRGDLYQNFLRQYYATLRMSSLGEKGNYPDDKSKILELSIKAVKDMARKEGKKFNPRYDSKFFKR